MHAAKPDRNRKEIVDVLRRAGVLWVDQRPEAGFDGLAISPRNGMHVAEIKMPGKEGCLTPGEKEMRNDVWATGVAYEIWTTAEQALTACGY